MKVINLEQGSEAWLDSRLNTFNASECGALFGCSPFFPKNQDDLAQVKYGGRKVYQNKAMTAGLEAEPIIRAYAEELIKEPLEPLVGCLDSDERFRASFDGITFGGRIIFEAKNSKATYDYMSKNDYNIPFHYYLQVQHQLLVSGAELCLFYARHTEHEGILSKVIYPDVNIQNEIITKWIEFETKYKGIDLPDIEEEERTDTEWELVALKLREINARKKELEAEEAEYKEALLAMANGVKSKGFGVTVYPTTKKAVDYKTLLAENHIDTSPYTKESTSWSVRVS